jgi:hypothetical protein
MDKIFNDKRKGVTSKISTFLQVRKIMNYAMKQNLVQSIYFKNNVANNVATLLFYN